MIWRRTSGGLTFDQKRTRPEPSEEPDGFFSGLVFYRVLAMAAGRPESRSSPLHHHRGGRETGCFEIVGDAGGAEGVAPGACSN